MAWEAIPTRHGLALGSQPLPPPKLMPPRRPIQRRSGDRDSATSSADCGPPRERARRSTMNEMKIPRTHRRNTARLRGKIRHKILPRYTGQKISLRRRTTVVTRACLRTGTTPRLQRVSTTRIKMASSHTRETCCLRSSERNLLDGQLYSSLIRWEDYL